MIIKYISNTIENGNNVELNLTQAPYMMLSDTDLFDYDWKEESVGDNFPYITAFKNQMVSATIKIRITENVLENLERFTSIVDADRYNLKMGRLYVGDFYRECYIVASKKGKVLETEHTTIEVKVLSEDGNWKSDKTLVYRGISGGVEVANSCVVTCENGNGYYRESSVDGRYAEFKFDTNDSSHKLEMVLDFGAPVELEELSHLSAMTYATGTPYISVYVSDNGSTWEEFMFREIVPGRELNNIIFGFEGFEEYPNYRYFKIGITSVGGGYLRSYGQGFRALSHSDEGQNLALFSEGYSARTADYTWYVDAQGRVILDYTFQRDNIGVIPFDIDLQREYEIQRIKNINVVNHTGETKNYNIQVYSETDFWTTIYTGTIANDEIKNTNISRDIDARYVRINADEGVKIINYVDGVVIESANVSPQAINNESYIPSDCEITIYGPTSAPRIMIGENQYGLTNGSLDDSERLEISTKNKTIRRYSDGVYTNEFSERLPNSFEKIPTGISEVTFSGNMTRVEITMTNDRSEPKWT